MKLSNLECNLLNNLLIEAIAKCPKSTKYMDEDVAGEFNISIKGYYSLLKKVQIEIKEISSVYK